jgi:hypothetical protein
MMDCDITVRNAWGFVRRDTNSKVCIDIPEGVRRIRANAFRTNAFRNSMRSDARMEFLLPSTLESVGDNAFRSDNAYARCNIDFSRCSSLAEIGYRSFDLGMRVFCPVLDLSACSSLERIDERAFTARYRVAILPDHKIEMSRDSLSAELIIPAAASGAATSWRTLAVYHPDGIGEKLASENGTSIAGMVSGDGFEELVEEVCLAFAESGCARELMERFVDYAESGVLAPMPAGLEPLRPFA